MLLLNKDSASWLGMMHVNNLQAPPLVVCHGDGHSLLPLDIPRELLHLQAKPVASACIAGLSDLQLALAEQHILNRVRAAQQGVTSLYRASISPLLPICACQGRLWCGGPIRRDLAIALKSKPFM